MIEDLGNEDSGFDEVGNDDMINVILLWRSTKGNVSHGRFDKEETGIERTA